MSIKVAIADDHSLIAEGVRNMLRYSSEIDVVASWPDGKKLLEGLQTIVPDVLLLDIAMPGQQGDELAGIIAQQYPRLKIIVLTSTDNIFHIRNMLQYNVAGYLLKHTGKEVLAEAIQVVHNGGQYLDETVSVRLQEDERNLQRQKEAGTLLTRREREILQLIADNHTGTEIAELLHLSKRTVEHHRESILAKLDVKKVSALVKKAAELNLIRR